MTRFMLLVTCALLAVPVSADDPPKKLAPEERKELEARCQELNVAAFKADQAGKPDEARKAWSEGLQIALRLYPKAEFPDGHANLATFMNNLGSLYMEQKNPAAAEPLLKDVLAMRKRLFKGDHPELAVSLHNLAVLYQAQGKLADAEPLYADALGMYKRLFKGDHPDLAASLHNLAVLYQAQGKLTDAAPLLADALAMRKRLHPEEHPHVAVSLYRLVSVYEAQGKLADAEPLLRDMLATRKRLSKGDHPGVVFSMSKLASLHMSQGRLTEAESLFKDALAMRKRLSKGDHPDLAGGLINLAAVYQAQRKWADAEPLLTEALDMHKRLFKGDSLALASGLNNLATLYTAQGKYAQAEPLYEESLAMYARLRLGDNLLVAGCMFNVAALYRDQGKLTAAEPLYRDSLAMFRRLRPGDHPLVALGTRGQAALYRDQGRLAAAGPLVREALDMSRRITTAYARARSEGEALTLLASRSGYRDEFLSTERLRGVDAATVYPAVWADKGAIARVFEQRQLQARAVTDPALAKALADLADARWRRGDLIFAPATTDPGTLKQRKDDLGALDAKIRELNGTLPQQLPAVARADKLNDSTTNELQKALGPDAAVVDFVRYTFVEWDSTKPVGEKEKKTLHYVAFVVTRDTVAWVDLDTAASTEAAVIAWREAITGGKEIPAAIPAKVRELVWEKVRKELPAGIKTVYVCPDADLCRVPWGAARR